MKSEPASLSSLCCAHGTDTILGALGERSRLHGFRGLLLGDDFASIEFDKHRTVRFDLFDGYGKSEIIQEQKLQFQVVEFGER